MPDNIDKKKCDRLRIEFGRLGVQYYVVGRFSLFSALIPIAGNLLHHAVEMFLKAGLLRVMTLKELKNIKHSLPILWQKYKASVTKNDLSHLDHIINELHRFELIRYPERIIDEGMEMIFSPIRGIRIESEENSLPTMSKYTLILEDVDELLKTVFTESSINPRFYISTLSEKGRKYILHLNKHFKDDLK